MVLFTAGSGLHTIDFQSYAVQPYQIYFMLPGQVHSWHFDKNVNGYLVHFEAPLFTGFLADTHYLERFGFFQTAAAAAVCNLPPEAQATMDSLFQSLLSESASNKPFHLDLFRLRLLEIFITVERYCGQPRINPISQHKTTVLRSYQNLIEKHYRELRLPKQYADLLYITPNHLNALCQDLLGKTAGDLIRDRILLEAKRMLTSADMTVTEIAYNLNFKDNSYFNRFFKKEVGSTPDEFRTAFLQQ